LNWTFFINLKQKSVKKLFILLFFSFLVASYAQPTGGMVHQLGEGMITCVSPNGHYAAGFIFGFGSLLWTKEGGLVYIDPEEGSQANRISDNGVIAGRFFDWSLPYRFWDPWDEKEIPLLSGGYYKDGEWHSLGIDPEMEEVYEDSGSNAEGISADGSIIGGNMLTDDWGVKPVIWSNGEHTVWEFEDVGQGAKITGLSADGSVACGWAAPDYVRLPVIWVNGEMRKITSNGVWSAGEAFCISPNGRYVAMDYMDKAAVYDVELDKITIVTSADFGASATAVSDNGIVVGYYAFGFMQREAFIYTEQMGMMKLGEYLALAGIPEAGNMEFETPMGISSDGLRIGGFGWYIGAWVIELNEHIGINTFSENKCFNVFPNPANDNIYIQGEKFAKAALYDMKGQLVLRTANPNVNISALPAGIYTLKIESEDGLIAAKKVVKR